jgi:hypothetical protein
MWFVLLIHPKIMNLTHKGSTSVNVIVKCLVLVKIYGNSPRKLLNRINKNSDTNKKVLPFLFLLLPRRFLNSLCSFVINIFHTIRCRLGISHILVGMNISPRKVLVQLIGIFVVLVDDHKNHIATCSSLVHSFYEAVMLNTS